MTEETKEDEVNWAELRPQLIRIGLEIGPLLIFFLCTTFGESWLDASPALRLYWTLLGWARGRTNRKGMRTTLERIRAVVESPA